MNDIKKPQEELTEEQLQQVEGGCKSKPFDKTTKEFKELTEQEQDASRLIAFLMLRDKRES